ncbi:hypothetical protein [Rhizobium paknamense]|uniref:DUF3592 domain-containing protein n=1 Tax=Rhizobium paknamense TaxID=1206817 RepID=A0ABU0I8P9_9HYPH|nr:hypothetical protein [Rhizobium paknamense]MDQ0454609.1 hypothetical protein [Rhizobium paknamense]
MEGSALIPALRLPQRPLSLVPSAYSSSKARLWVLPVFPLLGAFFLYMQLPGILHDWQISQHPLVPESSEVQNGRCQTRKGFLTDCEADLVYEVDGHRYSSKVEIMFASLHFGDYETGVVISADHPEMATLSLGLDELWNRIITLTVFVLLFFGGGIAAGFGALRTRREQVVLGRAAILTPVPVKITNIRRRRNSLTVSYSDKIAKDASKRHGLTTLRDGQQPLMIGGGKGKSVALAVRHEGVSLPVLLDAKLERISMTDEERAAALASLAPATEAGITPVSGQTAQRKASPLLRGLQVFSGGLLMIAVAVIGFWLWYVTASKTPFQSPGMDINNAMPAPLNAWGCAQLQKRFGQGNAPFGCVASDFQSWK